MRARLVATLLTAWVITGAMALARAESEQSRIPNRSGSVELEPMTVTPPPPNPLDDSLERLRDMMEDAPCLGCGPMQEAARKDVYTSVGDVISSLTGLGVEPPNPTLEQRLEGRMANEWRVSEYGTEMDAFR